MSRPRGLDRRFLHAMRMKLDHGRQRGYIGWDDNWNAVFPASPTGALGLLMQRLQGEVMELGLAIENGNDHDILMEAADVANFAMFIWDIHRAERAAGGKDA